MRKLVVVNNVSLDGVMQAPGRPDEDTRGGFRHGGWATMPNQDPKVMEAMGRNMARTGPLLFGRRTYEDFYGFWPHQTDNPFTAVLDATQKYVASTTLRDPLPWQNSTLLSGDVAEAVRRLKEEPGQDIGILGSGELIRTLRAAGLIDEYLLLIQPVVLGSGRRLFPDTGPREDLALVESATSDSGVTIATYRVSR